jgi:FkbM family methyltransferase
LKNFLSYLKGNGQRPVPTAAPAPDSAAFAPATAGNEVGTGRHVLTDIGGKMYRMESDDDYLDHVGDVFEPHMVRLFDSLVRPTATVLDVGANIGCTTILFGDMARRVISFEPSPTTYAFLAKNVAMSGLENIELHNVGLGKSAGSFELTFAANNRSGGFVSNKMQASAGHQVEAIQILNGDAVIDASDIDGVDFIKIDVEGFERDVIEGLSKTISTYRPTVTLELNHWCLNVLQRTSVPDFLDFLRSVFPCLYAVGAEDVCDLHNPSEAYHVMFRHVAGGGDYQNLVGAFEPSQLDTFAASFRRRSH